MDEVFRDGVNWGRIVGLFAFGGALCVECVDKEMTSLVGRIIDWMTVYLDNHIQPWIQSQGGWVSLSATQYFKDTRRICVFLLLLLLLLIIITTVITIIMIITKTPRTLNIINNC